MIVTAVTTSVNGTFVYATVISLGGEGFSISSIRICPSRGFLTSLTLTETKKSLSDLLAAAVKQLQKTNYVLWKSWQNINKTFTDS